MAKKREFEDKIAQTKLNTGFNQQAQVDEFTQSILGRSLRGNDRESTEPPSGAQYEATVVDETPLTSAEEDSLRTCEQVIDQGMETFVEVGRALETIRRDKLYRTSHTTFDSYMLERFGMDRFRGYELTRRSTVYDQLSEALEHTSLQPPLVASQLDVLGTLEPQTRVAVFREAAEDAQHSGHKLTAKAISRAAARSVAQESDQALDQPSPAETKPAVIDAVLEAEISPTYLVNQLKAQVQALTARQRAAGVDVRITGTFLRKHNLITLWAHYRQLDPATINSQFVDTIPVRDAQELGLI